jgi:hypothetical protein
LATCEEAIDSEDVNDSKKQTTQSTYDERLADPDTAANAKFAIELLIKANKVNALGPTP